MSANDTNLFTSQPPPQHHQHDSSDVLPGARGGDPTVDYSADVMNDSQTWQSNNERRFGAGTGTGAVMAGGQHGGGDYEDDHHDAMEEGRPMNVQPTRAGS